MIPLSYYNELPSRLPKTATLQGTGGCVWKVRMKKKQGEVHFDKGWSKFVKDNSLVNGDFMTFVYDGDCVFEVSIYGLGTYKETRAVATDIEDTKEDSVISISSDDTEMADAVPSSKNKGKAKEAVESSDEDNSYSPDSEYRTAIVKASAISRTTAIVNVDKKKGKAKVDVEESVESSDEDSDSDYTEAFGDTSCSQDSEYRSAIVKVSAISNTTAIVKASAISKTTAIVKIDKKKGSCSVKALSKQMREKVVPKIKNPEAYMDDPENLYLETGLKNRKYELLVHAQLVQDYGLKFADKIVYMDKYGELAAKTASWVDKRVCIKEWHCICERNKVKREDRILC